MRSNGCAYRWKDRDCRGRKRTYSRAIFLLLLLILTAFWMDIFFRSEFGVAEKFAQFARNRWGIGAIIIGSCLYVLTLSLPFVPGVELGVLLMCVFGKPGIVLVYFATVSGLSLAFFAGRRLPREWLIATMERIGIDIPYEGEFDFIKRLRSNRLLSFFSKYRYPAIGILLNTPGNYLIGGGGGIALICGLSRNISWVWFFLTIILFVAPVPLLVWFGAIQLDKFLMLG
jgi:hypothetical protein